MSFKTGDCPKGNKELSVADTPKFDIEKPFFSYIPSTILKRSKPIWNQSRSRLQSVAFVVMRSSSSWTAMDLKSSKLVRVLTTTGSLTTIGSRKNIAL